MGSFSTVASYRPAPKPETVTKTATVEETFTQIKDVLQFSETASIYGAALVYGSGTRLGVGVPLWYSEPREFSMDMLFSLGKTLNPNATSAIIRRMWFDDDLVLDMTGESSVSNKYNLRYSMRIGKESQQRYPEMLKELSEADVPAFRGQITIMFRDFDLRAMGLETVPLVKVEFVEAGTANSQYFRYETPSIVADWEDIRGSNVVLSKDGSRAYQVITNNTSTSQDAQNYLVAWSTKTMKVALVKLIQRIGDGTIVGASGGYTMELYYHPAIDRLIFAGTRGKGNPVERAYYDEYYPERNYQYYGNTAICFYIINPKTAQCDDEFGNLPHYSATDVESNPWGELHPTKKVKTNGHKFLKNSLFAQEYGIAFNKDGVSPDVQIREYVTYKGGLVDILGQWLLAPKPVCNVVPVYVWHTTYLQSFFDCVSLVKRKGIDRWMVLKNEPDDVPTDVCSIEMPTYDRAIVGMFGRIGFTGWDYMSRKPVTFSDPFLVDDNIQNYVYLAEGDSSFGSVNIFHAPTGFNPYKRRVYQYNFAKLNSRVARGMLSYPDAALNDAGVIQLGNLLGSGVDAVNFPGVAPHRFVTATMSMTTHEYYSWNGGQLRAYPIENTGYDVLEGVTNITDGDGLGGPTYQGIDDDYAINTNDFTFHSGLSRNSGGTLTPARKYQAYDVSGYHTLKEFLRYAAYRAGYGVNDVVFVDMDDEEYWGSMITGDTDFWQLMGALGKLYQFEAFESQGKVKFVKTRITEESPVSFEITEQDLAPLNSNDFGSFGDEEPSINVKRMSDSDLPNWLTLTFVDIENQYTQSPAVARRRNNRVGETNKKVEQTLSIPICMTMNEALQRVNRILFDAWNTRVTYEIRLPRQYMLIEPGDLISLTTTKKDFDFDDLGNVIETENVSNVVLKIDECTLNADWSTSITALSFYESTQAEVTFELPESNGRDVIKDPAGVRAAFLNAPLWDETLYFDAVDGATSDTFGELILMDLTTPETFRGVFIRHMINAEPKIVGAVDRTLPPLSGSLETYLPSTLCPFMIHEISIDLQMDFEVDETNIPDVTYDEFLSGKVLIALNHSLANLSEYISYREVTRYPDEPNRVTLTGIIRGRKGTEESALSGAIIGDIVTVINAESTVSVPMEAIRYNVRQSLAVLPSRPQAGEIFNLVDYARGIRHKPLSPVGIALTSVAEGIKIDWIRRSRKTNTIVNGSSPAPEYLFEADAYHVAIYDADENLAIEKAVVGEETVTITTEELTEAGLESATNLLVRIAQDPIKPYMTYGLFSPSRKYDVL